MELRSVVQGNTFEQSWFFLNEPGQDSVHGGCGAGGELPDQDTPGETLDEGEQTVLTACADHGVSHRHRPLGGRHHDQDTPGETLDEGEQTVLTACADHGVSLPVADVGALIDLGRALGDVTFALEPPAPLGTATVAFAISAALAKMPMQMATMLLVSPDVGVDRLNADVQNIKKPKQAADLLRAQICS